MPEGDTIAYAAKRMRPVLEGRVPEVAQTPEVSLTVHSHLRMTGGWGTYRHGQRWRRSPRRAWLTLTTEAGVVVQFDGPVLWCPGCQR